MGVEWTTGSVEQQQWLAGDALAVAAGSIEQLVCFKENMCVRARLWLQWQQVRCKIKAWCNAVAGTANRGRTLFKILVMTFGGGILHFGIRIEQRCRCETQVLQGSARLVLKKSGTEHLTCGDSRYHCQM